MGVRCLNESVVAMMPTSGVRRKFPRRPYFRHNHVTSQINFMGSAEVTTILGWSGGIPLCSFLLLKLLGFAFYFFIFRV